MNPNFSDGLLATLWHFLPARHGVCEYFQDGSEFPALMASPSPSTATVTIENDPLVSVSEQSLKVLQTNPLAAPMNLSSGV
jgi:hypothetical protein